MNWDERFNRYLKTGNLSYAEPDYNPIEDKIKIIAKKQMIKKKENKQKIKALKSLFKGIAKNKQLLKKSKRLEVKLPYKKGELILRQRSPFFKDEYEREKKLLAWN